MSTVRLDVTDWIAVVTLDNPPVNAQPMDVMSELTAVFDAISERDDIRVAVLTAAGKVFSAGADLKNRPTAESPPGFALARQRIAREVSYSMLECRKPIIAAVNGAALGAGLGLAASADMIVASERATFGLPEIDVGLAGGGRHAMRILPHSLVRRMMLTGYRASAEELYRRGVIEACLPHDQFLDFAMDLARQIASKSPTAISAAKDSLSVIEHMNLRDGYRYEQGNTIKLSKTEDAKEAVRAFVEKRDPVFVGR